MIKVFKETTDDIGDIKQFEWKEFHDWLWGQDSFQFDIETTTHSSNCDKKIMTLQFGSTEEDLQYVFQWKHIDVGMMEVIKKFLESYEVEKVIHNAAFEYIICRFHGIEIHNVFCTMLAEKVINGGIENANYALLDISEKYCGVTLDKTYQTAFGDGILTYGKVLYAADDVKYLAKIKELQLIELKKWDLMNVIELENKACLAFSDMSYYGLFLNKDKWKANIQIAQPVIDAAKKKLDEWLLTDPKLNEKAIQLGYLKTEDTINFNLNSPAIKLKLLQKVFPTIIGGTSVIIKKFIRDNTLSFEEVFALQSILDKDFIPMSNLLIKNHRNWLVSNHYTTKSKDTLIPHLYMFPAGHVEINWNSQDQILPLLKVVEPKLKDCSAESFGKTTHPIIADIEEYKDSLKLTSSFGNKFLSLVESDGFVRTNINQIVSTGRPSFSKPNMAQIPAKESFEEVGKVWVEMHPDKTLKDFFLRYRNAFEYKKDWWFVDSDFVGQELAIIAHIAKDEVWFSAITDGNDLHSICAEMVFRDKWKNAAKDDCEYYKSKQKCKCSEHKSLRNAIKTINFGLCYGMSKFKLSATLRITLKEAESLIELYFTTFPKIKQILNYLGRFGVERGYIQTLAPFFRKRRFPTWGYSKGNIQNHLSGIDYDSNLGSIERQSKNQPIQGSGADICKYTMVLIYDYIRKHNLREDIHMVAMVYDQLTTVTRTKEIADWWAPILDALMCEGANKVVTSGILKADTQKSPYWTK